MDGLKLSIPHFQWHAVLYLVNVFAIVLFNGRYTHLL
jgi:hypothetical protein